MGGSSDMFRAQSMGRFACQLRPRFDVACQNLSAAAPQTTAIDADTFITAMFMSVRSPSASAIHMTPIRGNGAAASIRDQSRANISPTPPRPSPRPEPISSEHAGVPVETHRGRFSGVARSERLDRAEICAVGCWRLEPPSYGPGKPSSRFMKCPCGEVFDMHGPEEVLVHLPHITAAGAKANAASARCDQCRT